jgi:hypothetical protein
MRGDVRYTPRPTRKTGNTGYPAKFFLTRIKKKSEDLAKYIEEQETVFIP